jgi:hypothetical protein
MIGLLRPVTQRLTSVLLMVLILMLSGCCLRADLLIKGEKEGSPRPVTAAKVTSLHFPLGCVCSLGETGEKREKRVGLVDE